MTSREIKELLDREIEAACRQKDLDAGTLLKTDGLNLLGSGVFDSLGILQLISTLEENTGVDVDLSEYSPSEFTNYGTLITIFTTDEEKPKK